MLGVTVHLLIQAFEQVHVHVHVHACGQSCMYKIIRAIALRLCKTRMSIRKETSLFSLSKKIVSN